MSGDIPDPGDLSIPSSVDDQPDKYVEKNKLRALVEKWRSTAYSSPDAQTQANICADELEEVIEDEA